MKVEALISGYSSLISTSRIIQLIKAALKNGVKKFRQKKTFTVSVSIVTPAKIKSMNRKTRGINKSTDVLSFPMEGWNAQIGEIDLGDLVVCPEFIKKHADQYGLTPKQYLELSLVHGTLHLLGYDHVGKKDMNKMLNLEKRIVKSVN